MSRNMWVMVGTENREKNCYKIIIESNYDRDERPLIAWIPPPLLISPLIPVLRNRYSAYSFVVWQPRNRPSIFPHSFTSVPNHPLDSSYHKTIFITRIMDRFLTNFHTGQNRYELQRRSIVLFIKPHYARVICFVTDPLRSWLIKHLIHLHLCR